MSQSIITLGIGGTSDLDWFVTTGLHSNPGLTGIVDLTLPPRSFTVSLVARTNGLTLNPRPLTLTLRSRP